jgi:uncharacterized cupredoxin-like copper-binding protein
MRAAFPRVVPLFLVTALLLTTGCTGPGAPAGGGTPAGAQQATIRMSEFAFDPATVTVEQGQPVVVTLPNTGAVEHDFAIPELDVQPVEVPAGQTGRVEFTPSRSGTFSFVCTEPGHQQAGMVGQLIVRQ